MGGQSRQNRAIFDAKNIDWPTEPPAILERKRTSVKASSEHLGKYSAQNAKSKGMSDPVNSVSVERQFTRSDFRGTMAPAQSVDRPIQ